MIVLKAVSKVFRHRSRKWKRVRTSTRCSSVLSFKHERRQLSLLSHAVNHHNRHLARAKQARLGASTPHRPIFNFPDKPPPTDLITNARNPSRPPKASPSPFVSSRSRSSSRSSLDAELERLLLQQQQQESERVRARAEQGARARNRSEWLQNLVMLTFAIFYFNWRLERELVVKEKRRKQRIWSGAEGEAFLHTLFERNLSQRDEVRWLLNIDNTDVLRVNFEKIEIDAQGGRYDDYVVKVPLYRVDGSSTSGHDKETIATLHVHMTYASKPGNCVNTGDIITLFDEFENASKSDEKKKNYGNEDDMAVQAHCSSVKLISNEWDPRANKAEGTEGKSVEFAVYEDKHLCKMLDIIDAYNGEIGFNTLRNEVIEHFQLYAFESCNLDTIGALAKKYDTKARIFETEQEPLEMGLNAREGVEMIPVHYYHLLPLFATDQKDQTKLRLEPRVQLVFDLTRVRVSETKNKKSGQENGALTRAMRMFDKLTFATKQAEIEGIEAQRRGYLRIALKNTETNASETLCVFENMNREACYKETRKFLVKKDDAVKFDERAHVAAGIYNALFDTRYIDVPSST